MPSVQFVNVASAGTRSRDFGFCNLQAVEALQLSCAVNISNASQSRSRIKFQPWIVAANILGAAWLPTLSAQAASTLKTRNVLVITFDGLRWQEVFTGADAALINKEYGGVANTNALREAFWRETPEARRQALLPFFWDVMARRGQLFGNTNKGSIVKVTNGRNFSYPGYNELLTGVADPRIDSNAKKPNPNTNVLEWLNQKRAYRGRVAALGAWEVFPYILNRERSGLHVRAGWEPMFLGKVDARGQVLNEFMQDITPAFEDVAYDAFVFHGAIGYLKSKKPRVLYIAFGETDDWAHDGHYDRVLNAAHHTDRFIQRLWESAQSMPEYRDKTTLVIVTDHGRGSGLKEWKDHGEKTQGSEYIWVAVMGPDTPALGERSDTPLITQGQIAASVAALLGEDYCAAFPQAARHIAELVGK